MRRRPGSDRRRSKWSLLLDLGLEPYESALAWQHWLVEAKKEGCLDQDVLILVEHPPVITLGRRGDESHVIVSQQALARLGIQVYRVERGGDVTYHGPGQIVAYPILDLGRYRKDVGWYVRSLEEVIIRSLADFGIEAGLREGLIGVWVGEGKIAAIGARIEQWITYHGLALNVDPDMRHFDLIVPCGIADKDVISMAQVLGCPVPLTQVRRSLVRHFAEVFDTQLEEVSLSELEARLEGG
ncbi:MAG: lipoyl(octanoyl) transferase LipB [Anaerolineae bacterium]